MFRFATIKSWEKNPLEEGKSWLVSSLIISLLMVMYHAIFPGLFESWQGVGFVTLFVLGLGILFFILGLIGHYIKKKTKHIEN